MPPKNLLIFLIIFYSSVLFAQQSPFHFPKEQIDNFQARALQKVISGDIKLRYSGTSNDITSGVGQMQHYFKNAVLRLNYVGL